MFPKFGKRHKFTDSSSSANLKQDKLKENYYFLSSYSPMPSFLFTSWLDAADMQVFDPGVRQGARD